MAFYFALVFAITLAITNVLYTVILFHSPATVIISILMAIGNIIVTVMTVYNMTMNKDEQTHFNLTLSEAIQKNTNTKAFSAIILPSLLLHWSSMGISSYTSMMMLGSALGINTIGVVCLATFVTLVAICATCTLNLTQVHDVLYKFANTEPKPEKVRSEDHNLPQTTTETLMTNLPKPAVSSYFPLFTDAIPQNNTNEQFQRMRKECQSIQL